MPEYLAVKNWAKYQGSYTRSYIRDYTEQDGDDKVCKLTFFQRQVLSGVRRIRGRLGKNVPNDATYIAQALHALPTDRPHVAHAIATLVSREFLSLTDQQFDISNSPIKRRKKKRREESRNTVSAEASSAQSPVEVDQPKPEPVIKLPTNKTAKSGELYPVGSEDLQKCRELYPAVDVMQELRAMVGWLDGHPERRKTRGGMKAFIHRWLAKAQNEPKAAEQFRRGQTNGNGAYKTTGQQRANRNIQALVLASMGEGLQRVDVPDGGAVRSGTADRDRGDEAKSSLTHSEILAGEPAKPEPERDA